MAQMREGISSKHKALSSSASLAKRNDKIPALEREKKILVLY
jgi:hypothetical protein